MRATGPPRAPSGLPLRSRAGQAELVSCWIEQHHPAIAIRRAIVVGDLRAERQKAVDLRITVLVAWLKADMYAILHSFALWNGLEEQPGSTRWFDDYLGVARTEVRVRRVADHRAPELSSQTKHCE